MRKLKAKHTLDLEKTFVRDEFAKAKEELDRLSLRYRNLLSKVRCSLGFFDFVRFCNLIGECDVKQRSKCSLRYGRLIEQLPCHRYGSFKCNDQFIINLSSVVLTDIDKELLCCGMHFGVPCKTRKATKTCS